MNKVKYRIYTIKYSIEIFLEQYFVNKNRIKGFFSIKKKAFYAIYTQSLRRNIFDPTPKTIRINNIPFSIAAHKHRPLHDLLRPLDNHVLPLFAERRETGRPSGYAHR